MQKLAYFDADCSMPEEIISAAGFIPVKILGNVHEPTTPADQYLPQFFCPAARSFLTQAIMQSKEWAGIIVAHGCDATNRQYDIWKMHVETPFLYWFNKPLKDDKTAQKFMKIELTHLISYLEKQYNIQISTEKLKQAIIESNKIKKLLQQCAALRSTHDISNLDYFNILTFCLTESKEKVIELLEKTLLDWQKRNPFPNNMKKIILTGSDVTYKEFFALLDDSKMRVVRDDLSIGERYFATLIPENLEPLDALVQYGIHLPRPATKHPTEPRLEFLLTLAKQTKIDGVVSQNLKFCEPYAIDAPYTNEGLKKTGIKLIHFERDFTPMADQQLRNRLEAFAETL